MVFPVNGSDECTYPHKKAPPSAAPCSRGDAAAGRVRGRVQPAGQCGTRHAAQQAREAQRGGLHGNLRESYSGTSIWAIPKAAVERPPLHGLTCFCPAGNLPFARESQTSRIHSCPPAAAPDQGSPLPCTPQPSPLQAAITPGTCMGGSPLPKKVGGRDDYPEVTGG